MMNKKGSEEIALSYIIYTVLLIVFAVGMFMVVNNHRNGGAVWEDFYAKEVVKMIDNARVGDEIFIDVQKASEIARDNEVPLSSIFTFNNIKNEVCVKLATRRGCYSYFNEVDVIPDTDFGLVTSNGKYVNVLHLNITEVQKKEVVHVGFE
jgi:hypothetical protein